MPFLIIIRKLKVGSLFDYNQRRIEDNYDEMDRIIDDFTCQNPYVRVR